MESSPFANDSLQRSKSYFLMGKEIRLESGSAPVSFYSFAGAGRVKYSTTKPNGDKEFFLKDHMGTTRVAYGLESGQMSFASHYFPFGKQFGGLGGVEEVTEKFTGKEHDAGIELDYFGARYYDADLGVWISPDPMRQFHSPYATSGNPINNIDPNGLFEFVVKGGYLYALGFNFGYEKGRMKIGGSVGLGMGIKASYTPTPNAGAIPNSSQFSIDQIGSTVKLGGSVDGSVGLRIPNVKLWSVSGGVASSVIVGDNSTILALAGYSTSLDYAGLISEINEAGNIGVMGNIDAGRYQSVQEQYLKSGVMEVGFGVGAFFTADGEFAW